MSNFITRPEKRVARKPHRCAWCDESISVGESYTYYAASDGPRLVGVHLHSLVCSRGVERVARLHQRAGKTHGWENKYCIEKADGSPCDPDAVYFVLRIDEDLYARMAVACYADAVAEINPVLARDINQKLGETAEAFQKHQELAAIARGE